MRLFCFLAVSALLSLLAAPAAAAVNAYLHLEGIPGESATRPDWIEIESVQWGGGRGISSPTGGSADREASAPSVSELTVTRVVDKASPKLAQCIAQRCRFAKVELSVRKAGGGAVYLEYTLTNVMISGYHTSSGGDRPTESLSLNFTKIQLMPQTGPKQAPTASAAALPPSGTTGASH